MNLSTYAGIMLGAVPGDPNWVPVPITDQRGMSRVGLVDVGAFESRGFSVSQISGDGQSTAVGSAFAAPLVVNVTATGTSEPVEGGQVRFTAPASVLRP